MVRISVEPDQMINEAEFYGISGYEYCMPYYRCKLRGLVRKGNRYQLRE